VILRGVGGRELRLRGKIEILVEKDARLSGNSFRVFYSIEYYNELPRQMIK
jgi:hypothetical protein